MAEARAEVAVLVVHHANGAVLDAEGVGVVVAELVMRELHHPAIEIAAVEDRLPVGAGARAPVGRSGLRRESPRNEQRQEKREGA